MKPAKVLSPVINLDGGKQVMKIIDTGGSLVSYLINQDSICPLLNSEIQFLDIIGEGGYGAAFLVKIKGMGPKYYVAKRADIKSKCELFKEYKEYTLKKVAQCRNEVFGENYNLAIGLNGNNPNKIIKRGDLYCIPELGPACRVDKELKIKRADDKGKFVTIPKGSYLCDIPQYSEYVIGNIAGSFYRKGTSINFIDVFAFATCISNDLSLFDKTIHQYIFMEKIDATLEEIDETKFGSNKRNYVYSTLLIQVLHALDCLHKYKIVHADLHDGNIFLEYVRKDTEFHNQNLLNKDWYKYKIGNTELFLKSIPVLAKIGDFGLSVKWEKPIIGNKEVVEDGMDLEDGAGPWVPNWYAPNYDTLHVLKTFYDIDPSNEFIRDIYAWALGVDETNDESLLLLKIKRAEGLIFNYKTGDRPRVSYLEERRFVTPKNILTNKKLVGDFMVKPKYGKIITLGVS
jgi:serine/threonine protein kinase